MTLPWSLVCYLIKEGKILIWNQTWSQNHPWRMETDLDLKLESAFQTLLLYLELKWASPPCKNFKKLYIWRIPLKSYLTFDGPPAAALG